MESEQRGRTAEGPGRCPTGLVDFLEIAPTEPTVAVMPEAEAMGELEAEAWGTSSQPSGSSTPRVLTWDHVQIRAAPSNKSTLLTTVIDGPSAVPASLFRLRPPPVAPPAAAPAAPVESNPQETHEDCDLTELRPKDELEDDDDYQEASTNLAKAIALEIQDDFEQFEGNSPSEEATTGLANSSVVQPARVFPVNHLPVRLMAKARWLPRRLLAKRVAAVRRREAPRHLAADLRLLLRLERTIGAERLLRACHFLVHWPSVARHAAAQADRKG